MFQFGNTSASLAGKGDAPVPPPGKRAFLSGYFGREDERKTEGSDRNSPFNLVIIDNEFFLQHLDGIQTVRRLLLG